jgi:hypothetical protein
MHSSTQEWSMSSAPLRREFTSAPAVRVNVPLLIGLYGETFGGKTFSALRLAVGIQRVTGGSIKFIDTENGRAKHYADRFRFTHIPFGPPHGSLDYLAVIDYADSLGPGPTIIDSASHEHEGEGGYLDFHDKEVQRLVTSGGFSSENAAEWPAWNRPARARQKLHTKVSQLGGNFIFCFRAKDKTAKDKENKVKQLGTMPIAGAFLYEMTLMALLENGARGVPTWKTEFAGEKVTIKQPDQFEWLYSRPGPLDEDVGEALARWAAGDANPKTAAQAALTKILEDGGLGTPAVRKTWIEKTIGHPLQRMSDLTQEEIDTCIQVAKEGGL